MRTFTFSRATGLPEAIAQHHGADSSAYLAGGTTLIDLVKLDVMRPGHVVDINRVGLDAIDPLPDGRLRIGALVRNSDLARHPAVRANYPVLAEAILSGASPQIRNMASTAGNLMQRTRCQYFRDNISPCNKREPGAGCAALEGFNRSHAVLGVSEHCIATHPSDMCVALAILEPQLTIASASGERALPFLEFHLLPGDTPQREHALAAGEMITAVTLPPPLPGARSWYVKLRDRESYEFALASAAVLLLRDGERIREARIALGGVGTKPWRAHDAEALLRGAPADEENFRRAADAALSAAAPRRHNGFKVELARRAIVRALTRVADRQPPVRTV